MGKGTRKKIKRSIGRMGAIAEAAAAPAMGAYGEYYPKAMERMYRALQMPAMYGGRALAMRGVGARMRRLGMAGSGAAGASMRAVDRAWADRIAQAQFAQARGFGALAGQAMAGGQWGTEMQLLRPRAQMGYYQQREGQKQAAKQQAQAREAGMWGDIGELGVDIGAAVITGGASIPASVARRAQAGQPSTATFNPVMTPGYSQTGEWTGPIAPP
jgi:hypothetical protein